MKVLHVVGGMDPKMGGVCQAVRTIIKGLNEIGIHNEVVSLDDDHQPFLKDDNFSNHLLGAGKGPWLYNTMLIPWLTVNLPDYNCVIVHGLWQFPGYAVRKAMADLKTDNKTKTRLKLLPKVFVMPHGMLDPYFQQAKGRALKALRNLLYWKLVERKLINTATGIIFTCEAERQLAQQPFTPYKPKATMVVTLAVEEPPAYTIVLKNAFLKKCPGIINESYLLFLGRIHNKKGVDLLIDAYNTVLNEQFSNSAKLPKLVIAGPGLDSQFGKQIQQMMKEMPELKDFIFFPGMLTNDAKWGAIYGCEAFILPSHQENFGIAVVEAMACKKPVLISNQINIWKEINDASAGLIADDDFNGTHSLIENWINLSSHQKTTMAINARSCFKKFFLTNVAAQQLKKALTQETRTE